MQDLLRSTYQVCSGASAALLAGVSSCNSTVSVCPPHTGGARQGTECGAPDGREEHGCAEGQRHGATRHGAALPAAGAERPAGESVLVETVGVCPAHATCAHGSSAALLPCACVCARSTAQPSGCCATCTCPTTPAAVREEGDGSAMRVSAGRPCTLRRETTVRQTQALGLWWLVQNSVAAGQPICRGHVWLMKIW
jgi:hypothetical protein